MLTTSVDRDDIRNDYGAKIWAQTIEEIEKNVPKCGIDSYLTLKPMNRQF